MILYGTPTSPYVRHARVALVQSQLNWQLEKVTLETIDNSPTKRVPFLVDGDTKLTDSAVIVRYVREQSGQPFLAAINDYELFALVTSVLDTAVNLFLMNIGDSASLADVKSGASTIGYSPQQYVERQQQRIDSGMDALNNFSLASQAPYNDGEIRLGCLLAWGTFRETLNLDGLDNLNSFLAGINAWQPFAETAPDL